MRGNGRKVIVVIFAVFALTLFFLTLPRFSGVVKIALTALAAAYLLAPLVAYFERRMNRALSILIVYAAVIIVTAGVILLVFLPMGSEIMRLPGYAYQMGKSLQTLLDRLSKALNGRGLSVDISASLHNMFGNSAGKLISSAVSLVSAAVGFFANALAALALSWFFLMDWEKLSLRLFLCVPSGIRNQTVTALRSVRRELGQYFRAQGMLIAAVGAVTVCVLWLTGTPMPVSMGFMYALLNVIPYFGPLIGIFPPVLAALTVSPVNALYTAGALVLIQQLDNYVFSPRIMGAVSGSGPAAVLISISAGGALYGVPGMFFALPAFVTIKTVYRVFTAPKI